MQLEMIAEPCGDLFGEYFMVNERPNIQDLITGIKKLTIENKGFKYLITLDDLDQALYTSAHAAKKNDLDNGDWIFKENIAPSWMDGNALRADLNDEQKLVIRQMGFKHGLESVTFEDIFKKDLRLDQYATKQFINANNNILSVMDQKVYLLKVPVEYSYETLYAFPNGYFNDDLTPFENYHFAKYLEENYDLNLFGMGADYISFLKGSNFTHKNLDELIALLIKLYVEGKNKILLKFLKKKILKQQIITLRYTEISEPP